MKKLLNLLLTLFVFLSLIGINKKYITAEEKCSGSTAENTTCSISNMTELSDWASNMNNNITGKVISNISLDSSIQIKATKTLDINGKTIKAVDAFEGYMFTKSNGTLTIVDNSGTNLGTIDGGYSEDISHNNNIGGINTQSPLIISGCTFKNMYIVNEELYGQGAAINSNSNSNSDLTVNGTEFINCYVAGSGGAIYTTGKKCILNDAVFKNCYAGAGAAIYCDATDFSINNITIDNCRTEAESNSAIRSYSDNFNLSGDINISNCNKNSAIISSYSLAVGNITINNNNTDIEIPIINAEYKNVILNGNVDLGKNKKNLKTFLLGEGAKIKLGTNFKLSNDSDKIGVQIILDNLGHGVEYDEAITCDGYVMAQDEKLKDIFYSLSGQEYMIEDEINHKISFKSVQIIEQPVFSNGYTVYTDVKETTNPITAKYQWYSLTSLEKTQIYEAKEYAGKYMDLSVIVDDSCYGVYDEQNKRWVSSYLSWTQDYLFLVKGLKKGDILTFDYDASAGQAYDANVNIYLLKGYQYINPVEPKKYAGSYKVIIPADGTYGICAYTSYGPPFFPTYVDTFISNISIERCEENLIKGETTTSLSHPKENAYSLLRVTYTNSEGGVVSNEDSETIKFGKVLEGNKQIVNFGSKNDLYIKLDKSENKTYLQTENMKVYIDGIETELSSPEQFEIIEPTNKEEYVSLIIKGNYISTLSLGTHTFFVKMSEKSGNECTVPILYIIVPTPDPGKKDESCEKVIGPTWHWNNTKGVCEEYSTVGTSTR